VDDYCLLAGTDVAFTHRYNSHVQCVVLDLPVLLLLDLVAPTWFMIFRSFLSGQKNEQKQ